MEPQRERFGSALIVSLAAHAMAGILMAAVIRVGVRSPIALPHPRALDSARMVWLPDARPSGGGGGGGDRNKEPPRPAQMPGDDTSTVPAARSPKADAPSEVTRDPDPTLQLAIAVEPLGEAFAVLMPGATEVPPSAAASLGPGSDGGAGAGRHRGDGSGDGPGRHAGAGGNHGGGPYHPGNDVTIPKVVREVKPQYTADAMSARIQGAVWLECVVLSDGTVGGVRVLRSLDRAFGLDREAVNAARQWRFLPATRLGEPVDALLTIELMFTLR